MGQDIFDKEGVGHSAMVGQGVVGKGRVEHSVVVGQGGEVVKQSPSI